MITMKGRKVFFTGKHQRIMKQQSKKLGLDVQTLFTGMMWELIMKKAREGVFLREKVDK